jgi:hypothetical protein
MKKDFSTAFLSQICRTNTQNKNKKYRPLFPTLFLQAAEYTIRKNDS